MTLRKLTLEELRYVRDVLMTEAFPPEEIKSYELLVAMVQEGIYRTFGVFEGGELIGYAFLWDWKPISLLDYLGVRKEQRNNGLGAKILSLLPTVTEGVVVIESEYPETEMQARRIGFYKRNGFRFVDWESSLFGVRYRIALQGEAENLQEFYRELYQKNFPEEIYRHCVQIPYDAEHPLPDCGEWLQKNATQEIERWKRRKK